MPTFWIILLSVVAVIIVATIIGFIALHRIKTVREYPLENALSVLVAMVFAFFGVSFFLDGTVEVFGISVGFASRLSEPALIACFGMLVITVIAIAYFIKNK